MDPEPINLQDFTKLTKPESNSIGFSILARDPPGCIRLMGDIRLILSEPVVSYRSLQRRNVFYSPNEHNCSFESELNYVLNVPIPAGKINTQVCFTTKPNILAHGKTGDSLLNDIPEAEE